MSTLPQEETSVNPKSRTESQIVTELAELPPDAYLDAHALGEILGRCKKSIQRAVRRGELPPPFKFMGRHVWLVHNIRDHMKQKQEAAVRQMEDRTRRLARHEP